MALTEQQQDRLRDVAQGVRDLLGGALLLVRIMVSSIVAVAVALVVGGLLTADPETATFRDFLITVQSAEIHRLVFIAGCVVGVLVWFFKLLGWFNRAQSARYPMAMAVMGTAKAAPKKEGGE